MKNLLPLFILLAITVQLSAQNPVLQLQSFSSPYTAPVDIVNMGDGRMFIVQQNGYIYICDSAGNKNNTPFLNISNLLTYGGEQGLLGLAFHPNYLSNGYFYVNYTDNSGGDTRIVRYSVNAGNPNLADPGSAVILIEINQPYTNHNGGGVRFGHDGYLYIGMGDGGAGGDPQNHSQSTDDLLGKMLRIDVDNGSPYAIPPDNPFINDPDYEPEIWSLGLRNPWRYNFDRLTGDCWIGDVGQGAWEEVDYEPAGVGGRNYGWRCYEGNHNYNTSGCGAMSAYDAPVAEYAHGGASGDCSISGGIIYRGGQFANMYGAYFHADYCSGIFRMVKPNGIGGWVQSQVGNFTDYSYSGFGEDRYGEMYVASLGGTIYKVVDTACIPVAVITSPDTVYSCGSPIVELNAVWGENFSYEWKENGNILPNDTLSAIFVSNNGVYNVVVTNEDGCTNNSTYVTVIFNQPQVPVFDIPVDTFCTGNPVYVLTNAVDIQGGVFSGSGVDDDEFNPSLADTGTVVLTYTYVDATGCIFILNDTVHVEVCTYIVPTHSLQAVISPNPSNGEFSISLFGTAEPISEISVFDVSGREVYGMQGINDNMILLNVTSLARGMYVVHLKTGVHIVRGKIVLD